MCWQLHASSAATSDAQDGVADLPKTASAPRAHWTAFPRESRIGPPYSTLEVEIARLVGHELESDLACTRLRNNEAAAHTCEMIAHEGCQLEARCCGMDDWVV
jgi:hypothetical protein